MSLSYQQIQALDKQNNTTKKFNCKKHSTNNGFNQISRVCLSNDCQHNRLICTGCIEHHLSHMDKVFEISQFSNEIQMNQLIIQNQRFQPSLQIETLIQNKVKKFINLTKRFLDTQEYNFIQMIQNSTVQMPDYLIKDLLEVNPSNFEGKTEYDWQLLNFLKNNNFQEQVKLANQNAEALSLQLQVDFQKIQESILQFNNQILNKGFESVLSQCKQKTQQLEPSFQQQIHTLSQFKEKEYQTKDLDDISQKIKDLLNHTMDFETESQTTQQTNQTQQQSQVTIDESASVQNKKIKQQLSISSDEYCKKSQKSVPELEDFEIYDDTYLGYDDERNKEPSFLLNNKPCPVIFVKSLTNPKITIQIIYNLFSNYGNIVKMLFQKNKSSCLIQFEKTEFAKLAKDYLNNIQVMGVQLRIHYSKFQTIQQKNNYVEGEETLTPNHNDYRFKHNGNVQINPISNTLHFSNLKTEACDKKLFNNLIGSVNCSIEEIKFICQQQKVKIYIQNMCIVKFNDINQAITVLVNLHSQIFYGRKLIISFTKHKI